MEISLNAKVSCADGLIGETVRVIVNPVTGDITHVTVRPGGMGESEHLVPIVAISESSAGEMVLNVSKNQFFLYPVFDSYRFLDLEEANVDPEELDTIPEAHKATGHAFWPFVTAEGHLSTYVDVQQIPHDELAIHRGASVEATNGRVGEVAELVINPDNTHVTHLVLRKGHIFGHHDIAVPVADLDRIDEGIVYLKIDKAAVKDLPDFKIKR
jgi:sporulation protein YlmC with PRC-barrel domain